MKYIKKSGYLQIMEIRHGLVALLIVGLGLTIILLTQPADYDPQDKKLVWITLVSAMVVLGFFLTRKLVIRSDKFSAGIKAEQAVKKQLVKLGDEFTVIHNFPIRQRGDIDFVVVGPNAVYCVEVKRRKIPTYQELDRFSYQARRQADNLRYLIQGEVGEKVTVIPVVALVELRKQSVLGRRSGVHFTMPEDLAAFFWAHQGQPIQGMDALLEYMRRA